MIESGRPRLLANLAALLLALALLMLTLGYWRAWLPHPTAALAILGVDLAEYVKFVPAVQSGAIPLQREVFFGPVLALAAGLLLLATLRRPALPLWLRSLGVLLAVAATLSMLPPAWTPALLRTAEFRTQVVYMAVLLLSASLSPVLRRFLPDWLRGLVLLGLAYLPVPALSGFLALRPALQDLYGHAVDPGFAFYLTGAGAATLALSGLLLLGVELFMSNSVMTSRD